MGGHLQCRSGLLDLAIRSTTEVRTKNREDFCLAMKLYRQWNCEYLNAMAGLCDPMVPSRFLQFRPNTLFLTLRFSKCPGIRTQISIYEGGHKFDPSLDRGPLAPFIPDVGLP
jgi:hypothetical protein